MHPAKKDYSWIRHFESRHLRTASAISMVIAHAKQRKEIQLRDLIAGIYVANFERILRFWPDAATFEDFVVEHCDWSEHRLSTCDRWNYESQHPPRKIIPIPFSPWFFHMRRKNTFAGKMFSRSDDLKRVYATAEEISPNKVAHAVGVIVPLITPELFLVATARTDGIEFGTRLRDSGINLLLLEQVALQPLQQPDKLMF